MRTDELVAMLAAGEAAVDTGAARRRLAVALAAGVLAATVLMLAALGPRADLGAASAQGMFWVKLGYPAAIAAAALLALARLGRPGAALGAAPWAMLAPVALIWLLAAAALAGARPGERAALLLGQTWAACPFLIALLSLPVFAAILWAMRGLAPTRLALAGAAAGAFAGGLGASIYALHCPETAAPFLGIWYLLGMLLPTAAGAALGPRLLRW